MRTKLILSIVTLMVLSLTACQTARTYVESGNYDAAIDYCVAQLKGKKKKKDELVKGLEAAFERAQTRDLNRLETLRSQNTLESWERAYDVAQDIDERQDKIEPLVPLRSKDGYIAHFDFVNADRFIAEAKDKAADLLYVKAQASLVEAETGKRSAAREAYNTLERIQKRYQTNYRDAQHLMSKAMQLGASHTIFTVHNHAQKVLPTRFEERIMTFTTSDLNTRWKKFDFYRNPEKNYHYRAEFHIERIEISPEFVRENRYWDEKTIVDGWEYVLDKRGNVLKDSTGRDIKRDKVVTIRAEVMEMGQRKTAAVHGQIHIYASDGRTLLEKKPLSTEVIFDNLAVTWRGDERALSDRTRCNLGKTPLPFPSDYDLLTIASEQLNPLVGAALRDSRTIY